MSVSTRMSATIPLVAARGGSVRIRTEGRCQLGCGVSLGFEVCVEGPTDDLGKGNALGSDDFIDHPTLMGGEVHLGSGR